MKKTDIGVVAVIYAICLLFLAMTLNLPAKAKIYPLSIIVLLAFLTTLYVIKMVRDAKVLGVVSGLEDFKDFIPKQFFVLFSMMVGYIVMMYFLGFYISSVCFMILSLWFLKVKKWQIALSTIMIIALVYLSFSKFLGVHLPLGQLFS